jgi:outer membrane protein assembly factor BamB
VLLALIGCAKEVPLPHDRSSMGLSMDGSRHVNVNGGPDIVEMSKHIDSNAVAGGWSTAPIPLQKPFNYAIGARNGRIAFFDVHDSLARMLEITDHSPIDQLLASGDTLFAISINGVVNAFDVNGKLFWQASISAIPSAPAILTTKSLIVTAAHGMHAFDRTTGAVSWTYSASSSITSLAYSQKRDLIFLAVAGQNADSIVTLNSAGVKKTDFGIEGLKITSNLALNEAEVQSIVFGGLHSVSDQRREPIVMQYQNLEAGNPKLMWKHTVPFIPGNIALNSHSAFASGFRTMESDVTSGIVAFTLQDSSTKWHREFTEPLVAPIAAGEENIYFTVSFESQAPVASRGIFESLSAIDGKTVSERAAHGAVNGFLSQMPMPDEVGRFLVADQFRPIVHIFDRSGLKRMF